MKMKTKLKLTAVFEEAEEGGYIAYIEEIAGANSQGDSLDEAKKNLMEVLELLMETQKQISQHGIGQKKVIKEQVEFA